MRCRTKDTSERRPNWRKLRERLLRAINNSVVVVVVVVVESRVLDGVSHPGDQFRP